MKSRGVVLVVNLTRAAARRKRVRAPSVPCADPRAVPTDEGDDDAFEEGAATAAADDRD